MSLPYGFLPPYVLPYVLCPPAFSLFLFSSLLFLFSSLLFSSIHCSPSWLNDQLNGNVKHSAVKHCRNIFSCVFWSVCMDEREHMLAYMSLPCDNGAMWGHV